MTFNVVQGYLQWRCSTERQFPQHIPCLQIKLLVKTSIRQPKQINVAIKFYFLNILAETTLENALTLIIELESTKTNNVRIIELYCLILPSVPRCHDDDDDDEKTKTSKLPASETRWVKSTGDVIYCYMLQPAASSAYTYTVGRFSISPSLPRQVPAVRRHSNIMPLSMRGDSEAAGAWRACRTVFAGSTRYDRK